MAKKSLNLFTILFCTFIFLLNACDTTTDDTPPTEKNQSPLVGTWETEESFNSQKGIKRVYEITSDNKITYTMTYIYDVQLSPDEEPIITEGQYMKLTGKVSSVTESVIKVTDMKVSADSTISSDIITQMIGDLSASNSVEIEYKDLTKSSVKVLNTEIDENDNEIETWITLVKVGKSTETDNTGNNNNNDNNTEYSIIGSWEGNYETTVMDGITMKMDATYTITDKSFTSTTKILEDVVIMDTLIYPAGHEQTIEALITKIDTSAKLIGYKTTDPETNETVEDFIAYRNLTATTVEFMIPGMNGEPNWLTFTKAPYTAIRVEGATSWADYSKEFEEADINEKYSIFEEYATFRELHNDQKAWEEAIKAYEDALVAYEADATDEKEKAMNDARKAVIYTLEDLKNLWDEAFAVLWDKNSNL